MRKLLQLLSVICDKSNFTKTMKVYLPTAKDLKALHVLYSLYSLDCVGTGEVGITEVKNKCQGDHEDHREAIHTRVSQ